MCGIAGFIDGGGGQGEGDLLRLADRMAARLVHRGPDDSGAWAEASAGLGLGFRRLAIQDLGPEGGQPMVSSDGRHVIVFNGEIYNFRELRAELEEAGVDGWRGGSDTEVMLAAISRFGLDGALARFDGMFAFALWDRKARSLILARDRMGEKPLYYGWCGPVFLFGSELKALAAHPAWRGEIDPDAVAAFMRYAYVPAPLSIYRNVAKLLPGHVLTVDAEALTPGVLPAVAAYWDARAVSEQAAARPFTDSIEDAVVELDRLLTRSVERRMIADVPLGAFLSGGIDSSLITALMQKVASRPVRTYTIGFRGTRFDESEHAAEIARHLGTDHTELQAEADAPLKLVERMPAVFDEPFADASQLPTLLLAELTRTHVTTALSGDGGDELFGGYPRYWDAAARWDKLRRRGGVLRRLASGALGHLPFAALNRLSAIGARPGRLGDKWYRLIADASCPVPEKIYEGFVSRWRTVETPVPLDSFGYFATPARWPHSNGLRLRLRFMHADAMSYLPDDLLVKVDRATMAAGLEARAPMLAHEVVEFAWRLPVTLQFHGSVGKWPLRQLLGRYVPRELVDRPKQGFEPPLADWLRGPLRDWAEDLLEPSSLADGGLIDPAPVRAVWSEHQAGARNWHLELWCVLMFQAWRREWGQATHSRR